MLNLNQLLILVKAKKNTVIFWRLFYLLIVLCLLALLFLNLLKPGKEEPEITETHTPQIKPNSFGFYSDSLIKQSDVVKKYETLSDIFERYYVPQIIAAKIAEVPGKIFDVRKIKAGKTYHIYSMDDSTKTPAYFVYEQDPVNYIVCDLQDSISIRKGKKEVTAKKVVKSAKINHSLYVALMDAEASPELAIKLSQIYAWQIDFYHLRKNDYFKVIYEEEYVDTQFVGIGKILGAYFRQGTNKYFAIPFVQDSVFQYFDEEGNSLRKEFLKAPLEFSRISSRFSRRRFHPVLKRYRPHLGVDYAAPTGTPIRSTGDGVVVEAGYKGGNGRYVKVRHNSVYTTMYLHMSKFAKGIKRGVNVKQGDVIGYVGSTGLSTGPHLDYRFYVNGAPVNPLTVEVPPSHPVKEELRAEYEIQKNVVIGELNIQKESSFTKPAGVISNTN